MRDDFILFAFLEIMLIQQFSTCGGCKQLQKDTKAKNFKKLFFETFRFGFCKQFEHKYRLQMSNNLFTNKSFINLTSNLLRIMWRVAIFRFLQCIPSIYVKRVFLEAENSINEINVKLQGSK